MSQEAQIETQVMERLSGDAARLACAGWLELSEKGWTDDEPNIHGSHPCILASAPDGQQSVPAGVVVFQRQPGAIFAYLSYVAPEFRGRGVYTAMLDELRAVAVNCGASYVDSAVAGANAPMRAIAKKQGRSEHAVVYRLDVR